MLTANMYLLTIQHNKNSMSSRYPQYFNLILPDLANLKSSELNDFLRNTIKSTNVLLEACLSILALYVPVDCPLPRTACVRDSRSHRGELRSSTRHWPWSTCDSSMPTCITVKLNTDLLASDPVYLQDGRQYIFYHMENKRNINNSNHINAVVQQHHQKCINQQK